MTSERKFIKENVKRVLLKEYLKRRTERSGFGGLDIQRTPMGTRVTLIAERPGMVIGRKGETIKELTDYVQNKFKFDNPQIEVKEVTNPNLNPHIMAQKLASALERGWHFRRAGHSTVRRIMSAGAKGCQVIISGKLTGQRHRTEKFREGHIKYCGETKLEWMHEGFAVAKKKLGVIGVKVQIMDPNAKLPDEIEVRELQDVASIKVVETEGIEDAEEELIPKPEVPTVTETTPETATEPSEKTEVEIETTKDAENKEKSTTTPKKKKSKKDDDKEKEPKKGKSTKKSQKKESDLDAVVDDTEKDTKDEKKETTADPEDAKVEETATKEEVEVKDDADVTESEPVDKDNESTSKDTTEVKTEASELEEPETMVETESVPDETKDEVEVKNDEDSESKETDEKKIEDDQDDKSES